MTAETTERSVVSFAAGALRAGQVLAGRYRLERLLGEGGMGVVWEARQLPTEKAVAVKVLKEGDTSDSARFLREARVLASLSHRHIIQVFDFWDMPDERTAFMVMELLRGETLAQRLARCGRLSTGEVVRLLGPVAMAVDAAHAQGIVHRDLKPENVFLATEPDGTLVVKVLDFGLAKPLATDGLATNVTRSGAVMGTPYYMAPEQVYGERDVDARADVWAFGVLLYECVTGARPFEGDNYGQVFRRISSGERRPMRELAPDAPESLETLCRAMLVHDRNDRLASLLTVPAALRSAGDGAPVPVPVETLRIEPGLASTQSLLPPQPKKLQSSGSTVALSVGPAPSTSRVGGRSMVAFAIAGGLALIGAAGVVRPRVATPAPVSVTAAPVVAANAATEAAETAKAETDTRETDTRETAKAARSVVAMPPPGPTAEPSAVALPPAAAPAASAVSSAALRRPAPRPKAKDPLAAGRF